MKTQTRNLLSVFFLLILSFSWIDGQDKKPNYGNIPDELVAYDKYQKAYKYHFIEPMKFYGAGREKKPPVNLNEIRLGFLGPLEGSILKDLGHTDVAGLYACN